MCSKNKIVIFLTHLLIMGLFLYTAKDSVDKFLKYNTFMIRFVYIRLYLIVQLSFVQFLKFSHYDFVSFWIFVPALKNELYRII